MIFTNNNEKRLQIYETTSTKNKLPNKDKIVFNAGINVLNIFNN